MIESCLMLHLFSDDVGNLLVVLSQFGFTGEAMELQSSFSQLLTTVHSKLATVWPPCSAGTPTPHVVSVCVCHVLRPSLCCSS